MFTQNFNRTLNGNTQDNNDFKEKMKSGNIAGAVGSAVRATMVTPFRLAGDVTETALNHTVFPVVDGAGRFAKGLFGIKDNQSSNTSSTEPVVKPITQTNTTNTTNTTNSLGLPARNPVNPINTVNTASNSTNTNTAVVSHQPQPTTNKSITLTPQNGASSDSGLVGFGLRTDKMPNFDNRPSAPFVASFGGSEENLERKKLLQAALTPHKGAQNGQLTANQLNTVRALLESEQRNETDLSKHQAQLAQQAQTNHNNNINALQREWLQQQGGLQRDALNQVANTQRDVLATTRDMAKTNESARQFDLKHAFDARKNELDMAKAQREQNLTARLDSLRESYLKSTDDTEKANLARQIAVLSGQPEQQAGGFNKDTFMKLSRNVMGADGMMTQQDDVIDLRTGQSILDGSAGHIKTGQIVDGMRFKGGNPNDSKNWEQVK